MRLRPVAFTEADPDALYESAGELVSAQVIRAQEASRLPVHIFPRIGEAQSATEAARTAPADTAEASGPDASVRGQELLPAAPPEHEVLLQQAQVEAERYLAAARERATILEAEGYRAGRSKGEEAARADMQAQFASVFMSLQTATAECARLRQDILQRAEADVVALAFHVARKIIQHEALCNPEILAATVRRALSHVTDHERVVVRVNPIDLQRALQLKENLLHTIEGLRHLSIEGDDTVRPGGCLVDSTCGEIDARLEAQCEELEQRFREHYRPMLEANVS
jgi:flagellar assembly protein FliH